MLNHEIKGGFLGASMLASAFSIPWHPKICTLDLAILSGPILALMEEHSRIVRFGYSIEHCHMPR